VKKLWLAGVLVAACAVSLGAWFELRATGPAVRFQTAEAARGDIVTNVVGTATVQAVESVQVATQVSGMIKELDADFNSVVHKDQVLARIDPAPVQAAIDQATAALAKSQADAEQASVALDDAKWQFSRVAALHDKQLMTDSDFEDARAARDTAATDLEAAQARVAQANAMLAQNDLTLAQTVIAAPVNGIVIARNVDVGQTVVASMQAQTLFVIAADLTKVELDANIDESDMGRVREGQPVTFTVEAYPGRGYAGTVTQVRINPVIDQNVVSYTAIIDVANPDLTLRPGMTANVSVRTDARQGVLRVPAAALLFKPGADVFALLKQPVPAIVINRAKMRGSGKDAPAGGRLATIWALRNGRLTPLSVELGISDGTSVEVMAGELRQGETVVTNLLSRS
jgi:HlyD family secretion protein